jgi:hypothetical protein
VDATFKVNAFGETVIGAADPDVQLLVDPSAMFHDSFHS